MTADLHGTKVAVLVANEGVEQVELTEPWQALRDAGAEPVLVAPRTGEVRAFHHLDHADTFQATMASPDVDVTEFSALVLPGGVANPDQLRTDEASVNLVRDFVESGRPVAVIQWLRLETRGPRLAKPLDYGSCSLYVPWLAFARRRHEAFAIGIAPKDRWQTPQQQGDTSQRPRRHFGRSKVTVPSAKATLPGRKATL